MLPTGVDEQGDEGRRRALEAATVARAEGGDWSSIAQYLRESPSAGPLRPEELQIVDGLGDSVADLTSTAVRMTAEPFGAAVGRS